MEKIKLEVLGLSSSQAQLGSFALVMGEEEGNRRLPIIIGGFEAQAIALEIENIKPNRPMTHDLMRSIAGEFHIDLREVVINDLKEGVFYSKMIFEQHGEIHEIDARPSDAIAIAVRYKAPVYTFDFILEEAGIVVREPESKPEETETPQEQRQTVAATHTVKAQSPQSKEQIIKALTERIERAIDREDYEEAARLRDEINKLEK